MQVDNRDELIELLILALIRLTAWQEGKPPYDAMVAWRSYDWDAIDSLQEQDLVCFRRRNKSITLTGEGEVIGAAAAEMLGEMLEAMKGRAEEGGTSSALPEAVTNRYAAALPLGEEGLAAIEAAVEERRRYAEMFEADDEETSER